MKKEKTEKRGKNAFGFTERTSKSFISDMFLDDGTTLQDAATKVAKSLDKEKSRAISLVLSMVKRLLKRGHKIEVLIKAVPKTTKSKTPTKVKPQPKAKVLPKTNTKKEEVADVKKEEVKKEETTS